MSYKLYDMNIHRRNQEKGAIMPPYKLLALDLDGTLLNEEKQISDMNYYWIQRATSTGVYVVFATGRGFQNVEHYRRYLGLKTPMVLVNGAEVWKGPDRLLERHVMDREGVLRLYKLALEYGAWFWGYHVDGLVHKEEWTEDMFERDWLKFGIRHDHLPTITKLREIVRSWGVFSVTQSAPVNMEVSVRGMSKARGIRRVCEVLGIEMSQVMAIGDSPNDLKLIQSAGLGIAVENAQEILKNAADALTASNEDDGVAQAIRRYLFEVEKG